MKQKKFTYELVPMEEEENEERFEVDMEFMHGDAQVFTHEEFEVENDKELQKILRYAHKMKNTKFSVCSDEYEDLAEKAPFEVPSDKIWHDARTRISGIEIDYYGKDGKQYFLRFNQSPLDE